MSLVEKWREKVFIIKTGKEYIEENDRNTAEKTTAPASCSTNTGFFVGGIFRNIKR